MIRAHALSKKGLADNTIFFILVGVVLAFMFLLFMLIVTKYRAIAVETGNLEFTVLTQRLTYSPNCLAYTDQEHRTRPQIVDWSKLTTQQLDDCYDENYQVKVSIYEPDPLNLETKTVSTTDPPGGLLYTVTKPVLVFKEGVFYEGEIKVIAQK